MSETGLEYLSSFAHAAFPFAEDATGLIRSGDPVYGPVSTLPVDIFVDAVITLDGFTDNIYLSEINNTGSGDLNINLRDSDGSLIMTIYAPLYFPASGSRYALIAADVNDRVARLVVRRDRYLEYVAGLTLGVEISFGQSLPFSASAFDFRPQRVQTFELIEELPASGTPVTAGPIDGEVRFDAGYNVALRVETGDEDDTTEISIEAEAGAGEGVVPCEDESFEQQESFMGLTPDSAGNIVLVSSDENCHGIVHQGDIIQLTGTCEACCGCDDYVAVSQYLKDILDRGAALYDRLQATQDIYTAGVEVYNGKVADDYNNIHIYVAGGAGSRDVYSNTGRHNRAGIGGSIYNLSPDEIEPVGIEIEFADELGNAVLYDSMHVSMNQPPDAGRGGFLLDGDGPSYDLAPVFSLLEHGKGIYFRLIARVAYPASPVWIGTIRFTYRIKDDTVLRTVEEEFECV